MVSQEVGANPVNTYDANKRVVGQLIERVWRDGQIDELSDLYHEGFAQWFRDFDNVEIEVQQQVAESDRVVSQMVLRAVHREKHRDVSLVTIRIDRITDAKIAEHWSVADMAGLMRQLA